MRNFLLLLVLAVPCLDATAQRTSNPFLFHSSLVERDPRGFAIRGDDPVVSPDASPKAIREVCMQVAVSQLIGFDDRLVDKTASILPVSPIPVLRLQHVPPTLSPKSQKPVYDLRRNSCVRGYESYYTTPSVLLAVKEVHFREVAVAMPLFEHLYRGLTTCEQIYGSDEIDYHTQCIRTIAEHLER